MNVIGSLHCLRTCVNLAFFPDGRARPGYPVHLIEGCSYAVRVASFRRDPLPLFFTESFTLFGDVLLLCLSFWRTSGLYITA